MGRNGWTERTYPSCVCGIAAQDLGHRGERPGKASHPPALFLTGAEPVNRPPGAEAIDHLPWAQAAVLHLSPGTLTMAALLCLTPGLVRAGCPRVLAYLVAAGLVGIPVMLGVMLWHARQATGRLDLWAVTHYRR